MADVPSRSDKPKRRCPEGDRGFDRVRMVAALDAAVDHAEDQVLVIDLGPTQASPVTSIAAIGRPMTVRERGVMVV
jgi:hypothetical protein